jgi:uncharacterized membrane protein
VSQLIHYSIVDRVHPPEYYLLLWLWIKILGNSETAVRLLSVLLGTIFLALLFGVMRRFATATMALFAILICAVSPFFVLYGGQVRPYSLIACLSLLSLYLLLRHREHPHAKRWGILYGLSCAGLIYSQFLGAFILLPEFVAILISRVPAKRRLFLYGAAGALSIALWLGIMAAALPRNQLFTNQKGQTGVDWILRPDLAALPAFYTVGIFGKPPVSRERRLFEFLLLLVVLLALASIVTKRWGSHQRPAVPFVP